MTINKTALPNSHAERHKDRQSPLQKPLPSEAGTSTVSTASTRPGEPHWAMNIFHSSHSYLKKEGKHKFN